MQLSYLQPWMLLACMLMFQPDVAALRRLYEQEFARHPTAQAARDLGLFLKQHGDAAGAREALGLAVRIEPQHLEDSFELALVSPANEAGPLLERAAASEDAGLSARAFEVLGHLREATGDKTGAVEAYRKSLGRRESTGVMEALAHDVEPREGIALLERAMGMNRRDLGARHPQTATTEANLAGALLNAGQVDRSIRMAREAMDIFVERLGPEHPRAAVTATILAFGLRAKGDMAGAERYLRRALAIDRVALGAADPQTISDERTLEDFLASKQP